VWSTDKSEVSFTADKVVLAVCFGRTGHQMETILVVVTNARLSQLGRVITFVI
jgi:hypothetical protein